ncbi:MAG: hypothetical protein ACYDCQ_11685, partial [Dehalococcoidia bacterium]
IDLSKKELTELGQLATKVRDRSADLLGLDRAPYERARETLQCTPDLFEQEAQGANASGH